MLEFLAQPENTPFTVAILVMFGIAILEGVAILLGFGVSQFFESLIPDLDLEVDIETDGNPSAFSRFFSWLRIGKVPILMLLIIFLTSFGLAGLTIQSFTVELTDHLLPGWLISIPSFALTLPVVSFSGRILEKVLPGDETEAISEDSLVGRIATITIGTAKKTSPAEARVKDQFGTTHYIMVEPENPHEELTSGSEVLLIRNDGTKFVAILNPNPALTD